MFGSVASTWISLLSFFVLVAPRPRALRPVCACGSGFNARSSVAFCTGCGSQRHARCVGIGEFVCDLCAFQELPFFTESDADLRDGVGGREIGRNEYRGNEVEGGRVEQNGGDEDRREGQQGGIDGGNINAEEVQVEGGEDRDRRNGMG